MFLSSCTDFFLIRWIANVLGLIMNLLYSMFDSIGIANVGLCIIVFTFCVKMLMFPLTLKQQRFTKLSSVMNPELQAIQKKYKGKTDQDSMLKMQEETKAVYAKYGTSQTGGCVQLLIQFPIIFALYAVISCIPNYVGDVKEIYLNNDKNGIIDVIYDSHNDIGNIEDVYRLVIDYEGNKDKEDFTYDYGTIDKYLSGYDFKSEDSTVKNAMYNTLVSVNNSEKTWKQIENMYDEAIKICDELSKVTEDEWTSLLDSFSAENDKFSFDLIKNYRTKNYNEIKQSLENSYKSINAGKENIRDIYDFLGIDLSKSPRNGVMIAILIPILSALTQWLSMKISSTAQPQGQDNPMASSMKVMSVTMPLMSAFFCYSLPAGLGIYWVATSVVQILQQLGINAYFKKVDVNDIIEANVKKAKKKREKKGIPANSITNAAKSNAKNINYNAGNDSNSSQAATGKPKSNSIASKANLVREYNEKNGNRKDK